MIEQRAAPRMMCADLVEVRWKGASGRTRRAVASLEDISQFGACLQVDVQIPLMTVVRITYPTGEYSGLVRYCQGRSFGHFIGVEFAEGSSWSEASFKPLHLLDPRDLKKTAQQRGKSGPPNRSAH